MLIIDLLKNHPLAIPQLVNIWFEVLGSVWFPETANVNTAIERYHKHLNESLLPLTFVALCDNTPVGMVSLRHNDGLTSDWTPWLGSLVVHPQYTRRGIAQQLIHMVKLKAKELGYEELFLFALDKNLPIYYKKLGWQIIGLDEFKGHHVTVMKIIL